MRKLIIVILALIISVNNFAQEKKDTTTIKLGKSKIIIVSDNDEVVKIENGDTIKIDDSTKCKRKSFNGNWSGIDIGLNGFLNSNNSFSLYKTDDYLNLNQSKSYFISINFAELNIPLVKKHIGIVSGAGLQFNNFRFEKNITLNSDSSYLKYYTDTVSKFKKNKLVVTYLTIPLLLEFQLPVNKHSNLIHLTAGIIGGLKIGTHSKQVFDINGNTNKEKQREDFHLSPLSYALTARIGYNGVSLFTNYNLSSLFKNGEGPDIYQWSAGLSFSF